MTAQHFGGMGGIKDGRPRNEADEFENMVERSIGQLVRAEDETARALWSALANVDWYHPETGSTASYSFRAAGDLIAAIRGEGDYMDWYCSGEYAVVNDLIARSFKKEGWIADTMPPICDEPDCLEYVSCGWPSDDGYRNTCGKHYAGCLKRKGPVA